MTKDIYAPTEGESVQIGQNTNSYSISLSDEMLASVRMSRVGLACTIALTLAHLPISVRGQRGGLRHGANHDKRQLERPGPRAD
jgi:hypothetical protein